MNFRHAYLIAFLISVAIISYEDVRQCHRLPWPPRLIYTGLTFSLLTLFSVVNEELAGIIAIGIVLAILVNKGFINDCQPHTTGTVQPSSQFQNPWDGSLPQSPTQTVPASGQALV